jgi:hypothetical protein
MDIIEFIGEKASYDENGLKIWGINKAGGYQMLADVRGWGAIQNLFKDKKGKIDMDKAEKFQDELGVWIAEAINEKLSRERLKKTNNDGEVS